MKQGTALITNALEGVCIIEKSAIINHFAKHNSAKINSDQAEG